MLQNEGKPNDFVGPQGGLSVETFTKAIAKFKGGVKVPHNKNTAEFESVFMEPPKIVTIPMQRHWRCLYADG